MEYLVTKSKLGKLRRVQACLNINCNIKILIINGSKHGVCQNETWEKIHIATVDKQTIWYRLKR